MGTMATLGNIWRQMCALQDLPDKQFWPRVAELEQSAASLHPCDKVAIVEAISMYAHRLGRSKDPSMNLIRAVAYISNASAPLPPEKIDALLLDAQVCNAAEDVSGVLFFGGDRFFQYIEGMPDAIERILGRIMASSSHQGVKILSDRRVDRREFQGWHMGFCIPPAGAMQELSQANWQESIPVTRSQWEQSEGLNLTLYYWSRWLVEQHDAESRRQESSPS